MATTHPSWINILKQLEEEIEKNKKNVVPNDNEQKT